MSTPDAIERKKYLYKRLSYYLRLILAKPGERFLARVCRPGKTWECFVFENSSAGRWLLLDWALRADIKGFTIGSNPISEAVGEHEADMRTGTPTALRILMIVARLFLWESDTEKAAAFLDEKLGGLRTSTAKICTPQFYKLLVQHEDLVGSELEVADRLVNSLWVHEAFREAKLWRLDAGVEIGVNPRVGVFDSPGPPASFADVAAFISRIVGRRVPGAGRTRLALMRAPVPRRTVPLATAQLEMAATLHEAVASPGPKRQIIVLQVPPGATKSSTAVDFVRVSPRVRLACLTVTHDVSTQTYKALQDENENLAPRLATRRFGILSAKDEEGNPLCRRLSQAEAVLKAGGSPACVLCPQCEHSRDNGGDCMAYGGREGTGTTALVTIHQLAGVANKWVEEPKEIHEDPQETLPLLSLNGEPAEATAWEERHHDESPLLVLIDEPPDVTTTRDITRAEIDSAIKALVEATEQDALKGAFKTSKEVRKRFSFPQRGPLVVARVAYASIPALMLAREVITGAFQTATDPEVSLFLAARNLLRASVDEAWAQRTGTAPAWTSALRLSGDTIIKMIPQPPEANTDWGSLDPTPWIGATKTAMGEAVRQIGDGSPEGDDAPETEVSPKAPLTWQVGAAIVEDGEHSTRALSAVKAITTVRAVASWLAPQDDLPAGLVRLSDDTLKVTAPNAHLVQELAIPGSTVVLDATPDVP